MTNNQSITRPISCFKPRPLLAQICTILTMSLLLRPSYGLAAPTVTPTLAPYVSADGADGAVTLIHITVIDGTGARPLTDQTVRIERGSIAAIRPTASSDLADGRAVLDMSGRSVLPGLVGMHDHLFYVARAEDDAEHGHGYPTLLPQMSYSAPRLYLAGGVTTIRTTGSVDPYTDINLRREIEAGRWIGPHMDVTGPYLQGPGNPFVQMHTDETPAETKATVDFWAAKGATSFKAYTNLTRAQLKAAIEAAHAHGLKITGHLCSITYPEAAEMGIDNLEHGFYVNTQLDPGKTPDVCPDSGGGPTLKAMDPDGPAAKALIALLVRKHVAITSTLPLGDDNGADNWPLQQRQLDVMSPQARETLLYARNRIRQNAKRRDSYLASYNTDFRRAQQLERRFAAAGGLLLAGPDPTDDGHILPGFGDQREIELLVDAGFSPLEAIRIGTLNGAIYLGQQDRIGSIAVGKRADLMIVKGDPSTRIADIENVELVFRDGLGFDSARLLQSVQGKYGLY